MKADRPENTTERPPIVHLGEMMAKGQSAYIEDMERAGGRQMLTATALPVHGSETADVQALGITWGPVVPDDPIFREATLPEGWKREEGENPYGYWTHLVDETGRRRASIFYKAAFYDRSAFIRAERIEP